MPFINAQESKHSGLDKVLKRMWEILSKQDITPEEAAYFNRYLPVIRNYYKENSDAWAVKEEVKYGSNWVKEPKSKT